VSRITGGSVLGDRVRDFRAAVVGSPVRHSLSPRIHEAAYAALGLDWHYGAFDVEPGQTAAAIGEAIEAGYAGLSVTTPLKFEAALSGRRSADVESIEAANTIVFDGGGSFAHNTDGEGLLDDLRIEIGFDVADRRCGVVGAGATARAVVRALDLHGADEIVIVNRSIERALAAAALAPATARVGGATELAGLELVVFALAAAAASEETGDLAAFAAALGSEIGGGQLVVDVNYHPKRTAILDKCRQRGAETRNGLGMLVHQAARQVELFTGRGAPLEAMWAALSTGRAGETGSGRAP
jgi:shikimate dehydrogenase